MKTYSTSELVRAVGDVTHAAGQGPVVITQHAKPRFVLLAIETYEKLIKRSTDPRAVYGIGETPPELAKTLLAALDRTIAELSSDGV
jgi:prevent-host-death family protein